MRKKPSPEELKASALYQAFFGERWAGPGPLAGEDWTDEDFEAFCAEFLRRIAPDGQKLPPGFALLTKLFSLLYSRGYDRADPRVRERMLVEVIEWLVLMHAVEVDDKETHLASMRGLRATVSAADRQELERLYRKARGEGHGPGAARGYVSRKTGIPVATLEKHLRG